jgi:hypothetical protein
VLNAPYVAPNARAPGPAAGSERDPLSRALVHVHSTVVPDGAKGEPKGAAGAATAGPATASFLPRDDEAMVLRERSPRCSDLRCSEGKGSRVPASASGLIRG